jgi:hypothetical protein
MGGKSTHLDPNGKLIAVYNDGDNSVYKHQTADTKEKVDYWRKKFNNTSGNGVKVGETQYWYTFMNTDEKTGTLTTPMYGTNIYNHLNFTADQMNNVLQDKVQYSSTVYGSGKLLLEDLKADFKKVMATKFDDIIPTGRKGLLEYKQLEALKGLSGNGDPYDIKVTLLTPTAGYLYEVKNGVNIYTTGRAMGNILFGENVRQVYDLAPDVGVRLKFTLYEFYIVVFTEVGKYNMRGFTPAEKKNFPMEFLGEHPYSGSFNYKGFFGSQKSGF